MAWKSGEPASRAAVYPSGLWTQSRQSSWWAASHVKASARFKEFFWFLPKVVGLIYLGGGNIYLVYTPQYRFFHVKEIKCIRMVLKMVPEYSILWKHRSSSGWWLSPTPLKNDGVCQLGYVGMMTFPTEWKVIKFHGSKPPTRLYTVLLSHITMEHHNFLWENHHF